MSAMTPARSLIDLAEEELGLIASGRIDEIAGVQARRDVVLEQMRAGDLDAGDAAALAHAHALQVQVTALLERATAELAAQVNRIDRGRASVRAYANSLKRA